MGLFDKFKTIDGSIRLLKDQCSAFFNIVVEDMLSSTEAVIGGQKVILAGTNNYLGLPLRRECIEAACRALEKEGTGTTGSRVANGTYSSHVALEADLSDFFGRSKTIIFTTGYSANLSILSTVVGPKDIVFLDADCHASIYDGCRLGGVQIFRFRHNDMNDLEKRLQRLKKQDTNMLIVVEGLYSMLGDRARLREISALKKEYGAYLLVDEAHSLGVLGETGRGLAQEARVEDAVDFITGTFSKSLGSVGGFCSSNHEELEIIRYASRPYVFTASSSPANIAAAKAALSIIRSEPQLREKLWENANTLYKRLKNMGFRVGPEASPIIPIRCDEMQEAFRIWNGLLERGVYVNMVLPPATPDGTTLLRCSLSAAHSMEQVEKIAGAFEALHNPG